MRLRICRVGGTAVYLHAGTLLYAGYMFLAGHGQLMIICMASILLHECAHAAAAAAVGYPPVELEITPMGAVMRLKQDEDIPGGWRLVILLAGPVMTLLLCWGGILLAKGGVFALDTCRTIFLGNLTLLCLNLLPAMPLDGGNITLLALRKFSRDDIARTVMRAVSTALGLICIGLNLWCTWKVGGWNLSLACAGCFMIYGGAAATVSNALHELRGFLDRRIRLETRGAQPACCIAVLGNLPLRQAVLRLHPRRHTQFWLLDDAMSGGVMLTEERIISAYLRTPGALIREAVGGEGS